MSFNLIHHDSAGDESPLINLPSRKETIKQLKIDVKDALRNKNTDDLSKFLPQLKLEKQAIDQTYGLIKNIITKYLPGLTSSGKMGRLISKINSVIENSTLKTISPSSSVPLSSKLPVENEPFFDLSEVKQLSKMEDFPNSKVDVRNLKFTDDEIVTAMNFDTEDVDYPKDNLLSEKEMRLVTYYTREGYYDMNNILTGNITKIAERYLQSQEIGPRDFTKVRVSIENEMLTATYKISDTDPDETLIFKSGSDEYKGILQQTKNALVQASLLTKALEKLPSFSSDGLNRKVACNNEDSLNIILKKYNPRELPLPFDKMVNVSSEGVIVTENRFMSTSKNPCANKDFGGSFEFHIKARGGKDIQPFSCRPDEKEVVLLPGTKLQIIGIMKLSLDEENPDPRYVISCRQIEDKKEKSDESTC